MSDPAHLMISATALPQSETFGNNVEMHRIGAVAKAGFLPSPAMRPIRLLPSGPINADLYLSRQAAEIAQVSFDRLYQPIHGGKLAGAKAFPTLLAEP